MKAIKIEVFHCIICLCFISPIPVIATELGLGYGSEFRDNSNIEQYEVYIREPLPLKWEFDNDLKVLSGFEIGMAMIREAKSANAEAIRISVMPQFILSPNRNVNCIFGLGSGFMLGNTEFTKHDLGGALLFTSKIGIQFMLGQHWNVGYFFFHQSNGGIYDCNASLNMHQLTLSYNF